MRDTLAKLAGLFSRKNKLGFAVLLVLMTGSALLELLGVGAIPAFVAVIAMPEKVGQLRWARPLVQFLPGTDAPDLILLTSLAVLGIFAVKNLYIACVVYLQSRFNKNRQIDLSRRLFDAYIQAPYRFHLMRDSSELLRNMNAETQRIVNGVLAPVQTLAMQGLVLACILAALLAIEPLITVCALGVLGCGGALLLRVLHGRIRRCGQVAQQHRTLSVQTITQTLGGIKEVVISGGRDFFSARYLASVRPMAGAEAFRQVAERVTQPFMECIIVSGIVLVVAMLIWMERPAESIAVSLALFGAALVRMKSSLNMLIASMTNLRFNAVAVEPVHADLQELEAPPGRQSSCNAAPDGPGLHQELQLDTVCFRYPGADRDALHKISMSIPAGGCVALVGTTGGGKTTLVDVILGILEPRSGVVRADGRDIFADIPEWHQLVGYVPQSIFLMNDTIRRNIAFGRRDEAIDPEKIDRAVRAAQLQEFVDTLPGGLDTVVGERGVRLSGGQRQRIGIARALYHDPALLVLDEATAALDNVTERLVLEQIEGLRDGSRTIIMIAHRLTTVQGCDTLYFLENGRIGAAGPYAELLHTSSGFRQLVRGREASDT